MCGIAGLVDWRRESPAETLRMRAAQMAEAVRHRGPDAAGVWADPDGGVALAQRRLAIIDLSPGGLQPMHSASGRHVIVFNGEIYNYREIARELSAAGIALRSSSDTEVLLEGCELWGIEKTLDRAVGMFAFALWDCETRVLSLVRDRMGKKPLYYAQTPGGLLFGSQLKSMRTDANWHPTVDPDALQAFLRYGYVPQPHTIYREARKVPQGYVLRVSPGGATQLTSYYDVRAVMRTCREQSVRVSDEEATLNQLDDLLRDAVRLRMISDVPLGAFLSGGIDSSLVVALMQAQSTRPVKTFSIGFEEATYNEAQHAKAVASHLGTEHTEFYVKPEDALAIIPDLPEWFDEPFADASQIPTYLVSRLTRGHVTVALSGDGGDELFAGYNRYLWTQRIVGHVSRFPQSLNRYLAQAAMSIPPLAWDQLFKAVPERLRPPQPGDKVHKLAKMLHDTKPDAIYRYLVSQWQDPALITAQGHEHRGVLWDASVGRDFPDLTERMQFMDAVTYLPDDILVKVDRATMAVGLEGRAPLLDHRVAEFAWSLPYDQKIRDGKGKWALRRILDRYVPRQLIERPKMGFGVPIESWLRGSLRDWAETLLAPKNLEHCGLVTQPIRHAWKEHLSGERNWHYQIWTVLMFTAWHRRWL